MFLTQKLFKGMICVNHLLLWKHNKRNWVRMDEEQKKAADDKPVNVNLI